MSASAAPLYPASTIAKLFNLTERRVQQLAKEGIIPKAERGKYELIGSVQGYVKYLQDRSIGKHEATPTDLNMAKLRLTNAQAEEREIKNSVTKRDLVPAHDVEQQIASTYKALAQAIETFPDQAEREHGATPETVAMLQGLGDKLRESLYGAAAV